MNANSYSWSIYPSTAATISGTTTTATVNWNALFSGQAKIAVKGINSCGNSISSDSLTLTINPLPLKPSTPAGPIGLCENNPNTNYSTSGSSNATSYQWSVYPAAAASISGTTTTAVVDWTNTFTGTAKISVIGINACGNSVSSDSLTITISALPLKPATPIGAIILCQNSPNTNYSTTGSTNATTYLWSISPVSAGNISGTSTTAIVDWTNTFNGSVKISVIGINPCGNSITSDTINVTINPLPTADFLNTIDSICPGSFDTIFINLSGIAPWSLTYNNGGSNQTINNIIATPYKLVVSPSITSTYHLLNVSDVNCNANLNDSVKIILKSLPTALFSKTITG